MHATLTPRANLRLIGLWLVLTVATAGFFPRPQLWICFVVGAVIGTLLGGCQLQVLRISQRSLLSAKSALDVRRAMKESGWGRVYLVLFWLGSIGIIALAIFLFGSQMLVGWLAGYVSMAFVRELIALPGTFELERLEKASFPAADSKIS
jgi:hypothetical protein